MCPKKEKATDYQWLLSGWQDSNLRPPHPKCGAIPGYATPRTPVAMLKQEDLIPYCGVQN